MPQPLVLVLVPGERDELEPRLGAAARAAADTSSRPNVRALLRVADDPTRQDVRAGDAAPSFEAALEIATDEGAGEAIAAAMSALGDVDPSAAVIVAGDAHHVVSAQGERKLVLMLALRRPQHMTLAECHDYWLHNHSRLARSIPGLSAYRQLHSRPDRSDALAREAAMSAGYDGAASTEFGSVAEFAAVMAQPEITADAYADEQKFVDHARSALALFAVHRQIENGRDVTP